MEKSGRTVQAMAQESLLEIGNVLNRVEGNAGPRACAEILQANRIACYGVGREGLMMKALCMRLMHLGLRANAVGDVTAPAVGKSDLLFVSAGPGSFSTVLALLGVARAAGARTMVVTAQPAGAAAQQSDVVIYLPAQTMADDRVANAGLLPMGSLFEVVQLLFFDLLSILLRDELGLSSEAMRERHTNLE